MPKIAYHEVSWAFMGKIGRCFWNFFEKYGVFWGVWDRIMWEDMQSLHLIVINIARGIIDCQSLSLTLTCMNSLIMQLQLHRNEVIALVNLLHRLSESVKLVHEMAPSVMKISGQVTGLSSLEFSTLQRIWKSVR